MQQSSTHDSHPEGQPRRYKASAKAMRTFNPIRAIVDNIEKPSRPEKPLINLSLGDPTGFGNLGCPDTVVELLEKRLRARDANGYLPATGLPAARAAIAAQANANGADITAADVVIASGCSGALDLAITAILDAGENMLVPCPGFPLYGVIASSNGAAVRQYRLLPEQNWEVDIPHAESLIDENTRAILVNNPSNPCGSVFSEEHVRALVDFARRHNLIIIADEIYGSMTFSGVAFTPFASVCGDVPVLAAGGLAKQFVVPGWRVGWVYVQDRAKVATEICQGLYNLSQLVLGANSLIQSVIPTLLRPQPESPEAIQLAEFHTRYMATLEENSEFIRTRVEAIPGLSVVVPQGAMYAMIGFELARFDGIESDTDFVQRLLREECIFVLPGKCFGIHNFFRIVTCPPREQLGEAFDRLQQFCARYYAPGQAIAN